MADDHDHDQFHFHPEHYLQMVREEVPAYDRLQDAVADATLGVDAKRVLDLGSGTGETLRRVRDRHPGAELIGVDESEPMLGAAREVVPEATFVVARFADPLPEGPFDVVVSSLAIHHLDAAGKADLFRRVAAALAPGGRFVMGDVIRPDDPADAVTPIDEGFDRPEPVADQVGWLTAVGLEARVVWTERDLAVIVATRE